MIESIFKSFDLSNVIENHHGPLFWNLVSKKAQLYMPKLNIIHRNYQAKQMCSFHESYGDKAYK